MELGRVDEGNLRKIYSFHNWNLSNERRRERGELSWQDLLCLVSRTHQESQVVLKTEHDKEMKVEREYKVLPSRNIVL